MSNFKGESGDMSARLDEDARRALQDLSPEAHGATWADTERGQDDNGDVFHVFFVCKVSHQIWIYIYIYIYDEK